MNNARFLSATALAGSLLISTAAFAQSTPTSRPSDCTTDDARSECTGSQPESQGQNPLNNEQATSGGDIVVTGSRIAASPNAESAVPITALNIADLVDTGDVSLGDQLNRLPSLRATFSQANSTRAIGTAGLNLLDLRGQGTERTLVLVNGRRHVSSVPGAFAVDVNTIPNALVERVDVVTGGSSAVYGSDAIAGVVNFVLKRDFEGIEARFQGGVTDRGDRGSYIASIVGGKNFAGGRGNIALSAEYAHSETVLAVDREQQTGAYFGTPGFYVVEPTTAGIRDPLNPNTVTSVAEPAAGDGIPDRAYFPGRPGSVFGNVALGGAISLACPAIPATGLTPALAARRAVSCSGLFSPVSLAEQGNTLVFAPDGTLVVDRPDLDLRGVGGGRFGGLTATGGEGLMLLPGLDRINTNVLFNYEFSPAARFYLEGKYVHITNNQTSTQPTFTSGTLSATFNLDNPYLSPQAVSLLQTALGTTSTTAAFSSVRFNNDLGTRAENHKRETYRIVAGLAGQLSESGNLSYDIAFNYGRTNTYYETGGNVDVAKFNAAANPIRNAAGQIVCRVNADAITTNDLPGCVPLNLFGQYRSSPEAVNYVLYTSSRNQWAEQINAVASISGNTDDFFTLPGGGIGFALGAEYRREDAFSDYDDFTQSGATFLNAFAQFNPPAVDLYEGFGEVRVPIFKDTFIDELTLNGQVRYSKYSSIDDGVWAWNVGGVFAPIRDIRFRAGYARSVRAPDLSDLYNTSSQTFANNLVDPCSQGAPINADPNRARNCAAAGVPTSFSYTDDSGTVRTVPYVNTLASGLPGVNSGNPNLLPETSKSLTLGVVLEPRFIPGLLITVDYYNIKIENVIAGLSGQAIINRCYDDPVGIDNPFCAAVFRRTSTDPVVNGTFVGQILRRLDGVSTDRTVGTTGTGFINQPFNYAQQKTSGIDADISYRHVFNNGLTFSTRTIVSWVENREDYTFITDPSRATRLHGVLGDPIWKGQMSVNLSYQGFDIGYDLNYIGKQTIDAWEVQNSYQGRPPTNADAYPFIYYPAQDTHDVQVGYRVNKQFRFYAGVDNIGDTLPPFGATGIGEGSGIFSVVGRSYYAGVNLRF